MKGLVVGVPWWLAIFVWLTWFTIMLLLTAGGLLVAAAGGVIWCIGRMIAEPWPSAGANTMATGKGLMQLMVAAVDAMNGHRKTP